MDQTEYMKLLAIRELKDGAMHHWTERCTKSSNPVRGHTNAMGLFKIIRKEERVAGSDAVVEQGYVMIVVTEGVANLL